MNRILNLFFGKVKPGEAPSSEDILLMVKFCAWMSLSIFFLWLAENVA